MFWLLTLWAIPSAAFLLARRHSDAKLWRITGVAFGAVVAPASLELYVLYFVGPISALFGMIGLVLGLLHGSPGYDLSVHFGLFRPTPSSMASFSMGQSRRSTGSSGQQRTGSWVGQLT